jgi:hypothetical protein
MGVPHRSRDPSGPSCSFEMPASRAPQDEGLAKRGSGTPGRQLMFFRMPASRRPARRFLSAPTPLFVVAPHPRACRGIIALPQLLKQGPIVVWDGRVSQDARSPCEGAVVPRRRGLPEPQLASSRDRRRRSRPTLRRLAMRPPWTGRAMCSRLGLYCQGFFSGIGI